ISDIHSVSHVLQSIQPVVIVNTAAMHHVENCEREPERAFAANALGPRNLAMVARDMGAILMLVSTDYVFDGTKTSPYIEEDNPLPLNTYGMTKLAGGHFVRATPPRHFVVRPPAVHG